MKPTQEHLTQAMRNWTRDAVAPAFPAQVLADVPSGVLVKIGTTVYELKVIQRRNMGGRK